MNGRARISCSLRILRVTAGFARQVFVWLFLLCELHEDENACDIWIVALCASRGKVLMCYFIGPTKSQTLWNQRRQNGHKLPGDHWLKTLKSFSQQVTILVSGKQNRGGEWCLSLQEVIEFVSCVPRKFCTPVYKQRTCTLIATLQKTESVEVRVSNSIVLHEKSLMNGVKV